ncbi:MAG: hypothetical protein RLZZ453_443 [Chlamydiota bacterium]|jgi:competence protein ComEC
MYGYTEWRLPTKRLPQEKIEVEGIFHIDSIKESISFFNRSLVYKGTFAFENQILPCRIYLKKGMRPPGNSDYKIAGTLVDKGDFSFVLKPSSAWIAQPSHFNLSEWRFCMKEKLHSFFKLKIQDPESRSLLFAIIAGEIDEKILSLQFNRIGLQHLLTVSGFHFTLIALCIGFFLRMLLPYRLSNVALIIVLSFYALFVGYSCAVVRAYIAAFVVLWGRLFDWKISGLNALGIGLIFCLVDNPLNLLDIGFQFSFLCTLALLLLYPILQHLFPPLDSWEIQRAPLLEQHLFLLKKGLRSSLCLTGAVHIASIPLILFLFHKFSLLALVYNLLFPACIAFSLFLLILSLCLPWIGNILLPLCDKWTQGVLYFTSHPPVGLDFCLRTSSIGLCSLVTLIAILFFIAIPLFEKVTLEKKHIV